MKKGMIFALPALAGGAVLASAANADAATACNSYTNPVYIAGSTASQPILQALAASLGTSVSFIYQGVSSCVGLSDVTTGTAESSNKAIYLDPTGANPNGISCDPTAGGTIKGATVDIGVSDVFPQTCPGSITVGSTQKEFQGPIQAMTFAVPSTSTEASISADAAYVVLGWAGQGQYKVTPWTDPSEMFIRTATSGTELMLSSAIGLPASKWLAQSPFEGGLPQQLGGNGNVLTALEGATNANAAIGILTAAFADQNRSHVKELAFQAKGQECGYLPDSDATHYDKLNVRQGRYDVWGPLHFVTNVDGTGNPVAAPGNTANTNVALIINKITLGAVTALNDTDLQAMIKVEESASVVPKCAMQVSRTTETGAEASYQPTEPCGCYYESLTPSGVVSTCKTCAMDSDCSAPNPKCRFGYCEAQ